jgi:tricorn protease
MWHGSRVYYLSDRGSGQRMNLHVTDLESHQTRQLTHLREFDVKFPSLGEGGIVFEYGGWIYRFDLDSEEYAKVPIQIPDDRATARGGLVNVSKNITTAQVSPDGKRALFGARGELFTVPAQHGRTINLTKTSGVHERNPRWSPDGKQIAFISDETGEDEVFVLPADGAGTRRQLTQGGDTYKYEISWSPDSKKILWSDKKLRLHYVDVASKQVRLVTQVKVWEIRDAVWSPDSRWIAFSQEEREGLDRVYLYSVEQEHILPVTDGWFVSTHPCFSSDGKYLFLVSRRDFNPIYSDIEWNHAYHDMERIYLVTLTRDTPSPFRIRSDEQPEEDRPKSAKPADVVVQVDADGLNERLLQLPIEPSHYRSLASAGGMLYYIREGSKDARPSLQMYDLAQRKETALGTVRSFEISADGKKMLVLQEGKYGIIDLPHGPVTIGQPLNVSALEMQLERHQEWKQIFNECWRQMRDFFYDPNMHGVNWHAMHDKYAPLVRHVGHRADLTYVIGEMIAELNVGHAYVGGGDMPQPARVPLGLLGAELERDASGYYRIKHILRGSRWDPHLRSPLNDLGVEAKVGDYILAVNGQPTSELANIYEAFLNQAAKQVKLKLAPEPRDRNSREVIVEPISSEGQLYYYEWILENIRKVHKASDGKVGYIHVPDMLTNGLNHFSRYYYPQTRKKALIIDMRGNAGGNVSPQLIERLRREIAMITIARNSVPDVNPTGMVYGPKVCLLNELSASDGDLFPYRFRAHQLGKLIGKRSWGGVVGIRGSLPLVDGGYLNRPEFSRYDVDGKEWIIEGVGVPPDIEVDNDPAREFAGTDEQLNRAIDEVLGELKKHEKNLPPPPAYPKK